MSNFSDRDLIDYVRDMYGFAMAQNVEEMFGLDPKNETGFCQSVRRSLTREIDHMAQYGGAGS